MINKIKIKAFKSIKELELECSNLNLFVGTNSSGKSTCLQALLLFEQNRRENVGLNGANISLGEFREVRNNYMPRSAIEIAIDCTDCNNMEQEETIRFEENDGSYQTLTNCRNDIPSGESGMDGMSEKRFYYLSCHRIGAMDIYQKNLEHHSMFGNDGEYALAYLLEHGGDSLDEDMVVNEGSVPNTLLEQVNYWLKYIIGTELSLKEIQKTNYVQVTYNNNPANRAMDVMYRRPVNIGTGVSYLISIIIACLASRKQSVILLENPEIHLHPKAQSRLCELLYFVARTGRQLFVETHSDHIFNGVRVGLSCNGWEKEKIKVNFLAMNEQFETVCNPIEFGKFGKIYGKNPDMDLNDLFDQFEIDLDKMLGFE